MIEEYYPNPTSKKQVYNPLADIHPIYTPEEYRKAAARKIPPSVYKERCQVVEDALKDCWHTVGDTGYPYSYAEYKKMGKIQIVGVCRHYDNYGDVDWNNPPFLLQVRSLDRPEEITNCTPGFIVKQEPHPLDRKTNVNAC